MTTMKASNPALLEAALRHIGSGEWQVDVDAGTVIGRRYNRPLGSRQGRYVLLTVRLEDGREGAALFHRVIWAAAYGKTEFPDLNHKNGRKDDNRLANLEEVTSAENTQHAYATGLCKVGDEHHNAKLTSEDIRTIRTLRAQGWTLAALGDRFGVTKQNIWYILKGKGWRQVA